MCDETAKVDTRRDVGEVQTANLVNRQRPSEKEQLESFRDEQLRSAGALQKRIDYLKNHPKFAAQLEEYQKLSEGSHY